MGIIEIIVTLAVVGVILYLVERYIPMDAGIKKLLQIVVIIIVVVWILQSLGLIGHIGSENVNQIKIK